MRIIHGSPIFQYQSLLWRGLFGAGSHFKGRPRCPFLSGVSGGGGKRGPWARADYRVCTVLTQCALLLTACVFHPWQDSWRRCQQVFRDALALFFHRSCMADAFLSIKVRLQAPWGDASFRNWSRVHTLDWMVWSTCVSPRVCVCPRVHTPLGLPRTHDASSRKGGSLVVESLCV